MVRAYNDWLSEYVAYAPERFGGLALLPNRGGSRRPSPRSTGSSTGPACAASSWAAIPTARSRSSPRTTRSGHALAERGIPLGIHVSLTQAMPAAHRAKLPGYGRFFDAPNRMIELIFAGVFDRFPELDVVFAEVDFGWVPYVKEQIDNNYQRLDPVSRFGLQRLPSEYIERHFHFGYMTDTFGLRSREYVGAERILWSSDYPHISADWPVLVAHDPGVDVGDRRPTSAT